MSHQTRPNIVIANLYMLIAERYFYLQNDTL